MIMSITYLSILNCSIDKDKETRGFAIHFFFERVTSFKSKEKRLVRSFIVVVDRYGTTSITLSSRMLS